MTELTKKALIVRENWYKNDCQGLTTSVIKEAYERGFNRAYSLLKGSMESGWISVKDNPPKLYEEVIFAAKAHGKWDIRIDKYCGMTEDGIPMGGTYGSAYDIRYWMPKPEQPKEENQDG